MSKNNYDHITKEILEYLYINQKLSQRKCAEKLNISHGSVSWLLKKHKIKCRNKLNGLLNYKKPKGERSNGWKGGKVKIKCDLCGKDIELFPCQVKSKNYCNRQCKSKQFDLTNKRFGLLTIIKRVENNKHHKTQWLCRCDCGNEKIAISGDLKFGRVKSCGCQLHLKGEKNNSWKGGGVYVPYDTYAKQINYAEQVRRDPIVNNALGVKCVYCGKWFMPNRTQVVSRIEALNGKGSENRFYCSNGCRSNCPTYRKKEWPRGFKKATSREIDPSLRQMCFERDDWTCQKCGSTENLHCHHIEGYTHNKMIANDLYNVITLCKKCHKEIHKLPGCHYHELRCDTTKEENKAV